MNTSSYYKQKSCLGFSQRKGWSPINWSQSNAKWVDVLLQTVNVELWHSHSSEVCHFLEFDMPEFNKATKYWLRHLSRVWRITIQTFYILYIYLFINAIRILVWSRSCGGKTLGANISTLVMALHEPQISMPFPITSYFTHREAIFHRSICPSLTLWIQCFTLWPNTRPLSSIRSLREEIGMGTQSPGYIVGSCSKVSWIRIKKNNGPGCIEAPCCNT